MLRVRELTTDADPVLVRREIRGVEIRFYLRPWDAEVAREIRARHVKGFEWMKDPQTGRREKQEIIDTDAHFNDMVDYIVAGFEDVGDADGTAWVPDLVHKKRLIALSVEPGAKAIWEWVLETSQELAFVAASDRADAEKNWPRP